jgi:hypothetical protein
MTMALKEQGNMNGNPRNANSLMRDGKQLEKGKMVLKGKK